MALPEPSWRVKTRPCPFYQQGRCMFADSCNFLHGASSSVTPEVLPASKSGLAPHTPQNLPRVIVDSPESSARSPPRSPRTTSLLLALRDVIGDPDDTSAAEDWSENLPTSVNTEGFGIENEEEFEGNWTAISDYDDTSDNSQEYPDPVNNDHTAVFSAHPNTEIENESSSIPNSDETNHPQELSITPLDEDYHSEAVSGLLSPIEISTLDLGSFQHSQGDSSSFDSGYAENWKPPKPMASSPPRSPSICSTFDLLSSPFRPHSSRVLSPRLGAFIARSPVVSPARTILPSATAEIEPLDLSLDSPQDFAPTQEISASNEHTVDTPSHNYLLEDIPTSDLDAQSELSDDEDFFEHSYGHTSIWDVDSGPTAVYMGAEGESLVQNDVNQAIQRSSRTPTHFLASREIEFQDEEPIHSSLNYDQEETPNEPGEFSATEHPENGSLDSLDEDATTFLAYLRDSPAMRPNNDTIDSFYDIYSNIASPKEIIADSIRNAGLSPPPAAPTPLSNSSTPISSVRERVFTPPTLSQKRAGNIADSPTSLSSPITSIGSISHDHGSPFSPPSSASGSGRRSPFAQEVEASKKIPFGFRHSLSRGGASSSSLLLKGVRPTPLDIHAEVPQSGPAGPSSPISPVARGLKPLRLSTVVYAKSISRSIRQSRLSIASVNSFRQSQNKHRPSPSSTSVSSSNSLSNLPLLSSARSSLIPLHIRSSLLSSHSQALSPLSPEVFRNLATFEEPPQSAPPTSWHRPSSFNRPSSRLSEPGYESRDDDEDEAAETEIQRRDTYDETICRPLPTAPHSAPVTRPPSNARRRAYASYISTSTAPRPTLMFAIASDNVEQVRQVLESGDAGPNDAVGPQSALAFTLTNDKLTNKLEIVKTLLAFGADPTDLKNLEIPQSRDNEVDADAEGAETVHPPAPAKPLMDSMDPATRYYVDKAEAPHTKRSSALIHRSFFRPLTKVRYELVGQDRALEQLFRVLSMHSRELSTTPMVVMLCGPSGHGKSLLARKFGSLLDVPTHTVNMTTLRSTRDLWQSYSMSPYETPTTCTLAEFLVNNEGKRCVVVLDEIEKTEDEKTLWSLHMPWELGRCAFEAHSRHVDVRNVIWLGTSNIGHDLVFKHREGRNNPEELMSREEYIQLMALLRPKVSERLGASLLSRITTVLPFVPFTLDEKKAICSEALHNLGGEAAHALTSDVTVSAIDTALTDYIEVEGARSLYRAISNQLVDML